MLRDEDNSVRKYAYNREGQGNDGVTRRARDAAGSEPGGIIGQVAGICCSQSQKGGEGENVLHFENV